MRMIRPAGVVALLVLLAAWPGAPVSAVDGSTAQIKVWDTAVPVPPSLSLGTTPGESVEDPAGESGHGTGFPTVATVYARSSHPGGLSGISLWNPDSNVFVWYGKTVPGPLTGSNPLPSSGFPASVDINRGGPVRAGGPFGTSFGPGDIWVGGHQNEPLYVLMAGTDPATGAGRFRSYGTDNPALPPSGQALGIEVDEVTGNVFVAQPGERRLLRLIPSTANVTIWRLEDACAGSCGNPTYVAADAVSRPYTTTVNSARGDGIIRLSPGADGVLGINPVTQVTDDAVMLWVLPTQPAFRSPPAVLTDPQENPNGVITVDAAGSVWFSETAAGKVGRLSGGPDGTLGTRDDQICEYTTPGLLNPQQIAASGSGAGLQVLFTEGEGNSVSVLTPAEADQAPFPSRACTTVAPAVFPVPAVSLQTRTFDELVPSLQTAIVPTIHQVSPAGGSGIRRYSPMPNPLLSTDGNPIGDAGNGFPSGLTGVYAAQRVAGAYLRGNKHFELTSASITAAAQSPEGGWPGRMTGGGRLVSVDGQKVTHGFVLRCAVDQRRKDALQVNWGDGHRFHLARVEAASCGDDPSITPDPRRASFDTHSGRGVGRYDGRDGATITWRLTDAGEPGTSDTVRLVIRDASGATVLDVSGQLQKGNHQAYDAKTD